MYLLLLPVRPSMFGEWWYSTYIPFESAKGFAMARTKLTNATAHTPRRKGQLPTKVCAGCGRPFEWRKKWARCWDEVRYCSERCRRASRL